MKILKKNLRIKFISNLSLQQKAQLKYLIALTSPINMRSLFLSAINQNRNSTELGFIYEKFRPTKVHETLTRVGGGNDGGYLIPNTPIRFDGLISPGVGESSKFELELARSQMRTILIDATVAEPSNLPEHFLFLPKFLGASDGVNVISIKTLIRDYFQKCNNLVLQMDIEGGEYEILGNLEKSDLEPFGLILVEFHYLEKILKTKQRKTVLAALELLSQEFVLVHTHPNNAGGFFVDRYVKYPRVLETTWARKGSVTVQAGKSELPHPLDQDNDRLIYSLEFPTAPGS